jgi:gliding motility-associated-like protein
LCGYHSSDSVTVVKSYVDISVMNDVTICEGGTATLSGSGTGIIEWTGLIGQTPIVSPTQTTQYEATVSNICGVAKDTVTIVVDEIPYFSLGEDTIVCEQHPIIIGIPYMENGIFLWSTGYSTNEIQINSPNTYILNVTRGACNYSDTIVLNPGFCNWWIPNAFSPDVTGLNEEFKPLGVPIPQYEMIIFDRWGEVVFRTWNWDNGWDGTYQNEKLPVGVYIYQIYGEATASKIKGLVKQGQVTLMR